MPISHPLATSDQYLVLKQSVEKSPSGEILKVETWIYGTFTSQTKASGMAAKYNATMVRMSRDSEKMVKAVTTV